ncbi:uncharacterized protein FOMMEDRAFT_27213 [Fomitiporia mediterranea MF3/22]|uniref:uncharacterized protein n=1 Tax=Fomitiporia mediterranea (strain MF3/22) TaxID=694068 RepID=UPI0004408557|nr:uncharacterized protein FOMMEDRAFT_27213 [Fomitiporia mediterranea MF3/22]EJD04929.1 hypothetical protein FOMMEDRAFT_27213 [Fomitiporia mediterranea MF3/22]
MYTLQLEIEGPPEPGISDEIVLRVHIRIFSISAHSDIPRIVFFGYLSIVATRALAVYEYLMNIAGEAQQYLQPTYTSVSDTNYDNCKTVPVVSSYCVSGTFGILLKTMLTGGALYCLCIICVAFANMMVLLRKESSLSLILLTQQGVLTCILSNRFILQLRHVDHAQVPLVVMRPNCDAPFIPSSHNLHHLGLVLTWLFIST